MVYEVFVKGAKEGFELAVILLVHSQHVIEAVEIRPRDLPADALGNVDAAPRGCLDRTVVRRLAYVVRVSSGRLDDKLLV